MTVTLCFGQQNAIGHHAQLGFRPSAIGKSNRPANFTTQFHPNLLGHPSGHRTGRDASRLGVPNHASALYARNLLALLEPMFKDGQFSLDTEDELIAGCLIAQDGSIRRGDVLTPGAN